MMYCVRVSYGPCEHGSEDEARASSVALFRSVRRSTHLLDLIGDLLERLRILGCQLSGLDETLLVECGICAQG